MAKRFPQKVRTAYHEAGHAVMCTHFQMSLKKYRSEFAVKSASIVPGREFRGRVRMARMKGDVSLDVEQRHKFEYHIMVSMAGQAAECILLDRKNEAAYFKGGSRFDFEHIIEVMIRLVGQPNETQPYFRLLWARTLNTLRNVNWEAVRLVAGALLEKNELSGDEVRALYKTAGPRFIRHLPS